MFYFYKEAHSGSCTSHSAATESNTLFYFMINILFNSHLKLLKTLGIMELNVIPNVCSEYSEQYLRDCHRHSQKAPSLSNDNFIFSYLPAGWQFGASSGKALCRRRTIQIVTPLGSKRC